MRRGRKVSVLALGVVLALGAAACGRSDSGSGGGTSDPGISDTTIKLGGSYPLSGPASAYGAISKGVEGYFKYINDNGGVNGKKIDFKFYDDGYDPARALTNAKKLVEQDKVFALFNTLGTANNLATWNYLNQKKVPQLFVSTGASEFGSDVKSHPYTTGWQPDYRTEALSYAAYIKQNKPNAKVAVLFQNDAYGEDLLGGFTEGIKGSSITIVAKESYEPTDPDVKSQVTKLAGSGADTFLDITTPKFGAQAVAIVGQTKWKPLHILNAVAASKTQVLKPVGFNLAQGIVTAAYLKNADDKRWANDPAMLDFKAQAKKYAPTADQADPFTIYGWTVAYTMVEALKKTPDLTRDNLMKTVRSLDMELPLGLPGVKIKMNGDTDGFPIQATQIAQFEGDDFQLKGDVIQTS